MARMTISLPDDVAERARGEARRRGISLSTVISNSLKSTLVNPTAAKLPWQGIVSDPTSRARDIDAELARTWSEQISSKL